MINNAPYFSDTLFTQPDIQHGFFGRRGGVSEGVFDSLNCALSSGDHLDHVAQNRAIVQEIMGANRLISLMQIHSSVCHVIADRDAPRMEGDAMVTALPQIALGILTADCVPVLFSGRTHTGKPIIGAAHAGWRGALSGILENTIAQMEALGAERNTIHATIGPCIAVESYEVQTDFAAPFLAQDPLNAVFFIPSPHNDQKYLFDLFGYVRQILMKAAIGHVTGNPRDTLANKDDFFSYRRACINGDTDYGRQISVIVIR
jgi:YfiH family protein